MRLASWLALVALAVAAMALAACGSDDSGGGSAGTSTSGGTATTVNANGQCGTVISRPVDDPDGIVARLPEATQRLYAGYEIPVLTSAWADFEGKPKPWKIGYSAGFPLEAAQSISFHNQVKRMFAEAKEQGLVTGELMESIAPNSSTATAAQQIAGIQKMIRDGVDAVIVLPLSGPALAPVIDQAARKGIPMIPVLQSIPEARARVGFSLAGAGGNAEPSAGVLRLIGGKGNVLIVRGIAGVPFETQAYNAIKQNLSVCPDVKVAGEVNGNWAIPKVKAAVLDFLASHPESIDAVILVGDFTAGAIQAFEQAGRDVPVMTAATANVGELAWWKENPDYKGMVGSSANGTQEAYAEWQILMRMLDGRGLKVSDIVVPAPLITRDNFEEFVVPGTNLNSIGEPGGPIDALGSDEILDGFFTEPGSPQR